MAAGYVMTGLVIRLNSAIRSQLSAGKELGFLILMMAAGDVTQRHILKL
jgi:hypothetical protein